MGDYGKCIFQPDERNDATTLVLWRLPSGSRLVWSHLCVSFQLIGKAAAEDASRIMKRTSLKHTWSSKMLTYRKAARNPSDSTARIRRRRSRSQKPTARRTPVSLGRRPTRSYILTRSLLRVLLLRGSELLERERSCFFYLRHGISRKRVKMPQEIPKYSFVKKNFKTLL